MPTKLVIERADIGYGAPIPKSSLLKSPASIAPLRNSPDDLAHRILAVELQLAELSACVKALTRSRRERKNANGK